jgi:hypothetical protein
MGQISQKQASKAALICLNSYEQTKAHRFQALPLARGEVFDVSERIAYPDR